MFLFLLAIIGGCLALYFGGDLLLKGATAIGTRLGWSAAIIGFVIVSLGTSAPELFVSAGAALQGYGDIAAGNVVGSNIVNIAIVLGLGALIMPLSINSAIRKHQMPLMLIVTIMGCVFLFDGHLSRLEGILLLIAAVASVLWAMRAEGGLTSEEIVDTDKNAADSPSYPMSAVFIVCGVLLLLVGAEGLIWGGIGIAAVFGVPDAVIALTVTSVGTGLPEITATVLAVARRDSDMAVGNVVGSNLLNIGLVLGLSGAIAPMNSEGLGVMPLMIMLLLTLLLVALAWRPGYVTRWVGASLLASFAAYTVLLVQ